LEDGYGVANQPGGVGLISNQEEGGNFRARRGGAWGRVEAGLVGLASADGFLHGVVDSRDDLLG